MRELKFRAWDKARKAWVKQDGNPYVFPFEGITAMTCAGNGTGHISKEDMSAYYELSQFTGLLDKNGKEIYEGDIVKWCLPKGYRVTMAPEDDPLAFIFGVAPGEISEDSTFIDTVEYRDGSFYLMCKDTGGGALLSKHNDKAEIIGNIYEGVHSGEKCDIVEEWKKNTDGQSLNPLGGTE